MADKKKTGKKSNNKPNDIVAIRVPGSVSPWGRDNIRNTLGQERYDSDGPGTIDFGFDPLYARPVIAATMPYAGSINNASDRTIDLTGESPIRGGALWDKILHRWRN